MKASELIKELQNQIDQHGDCEVYYEYDSGIRIRCEDVSHFKKILENEYTGDNGAWGTLSDVIVINHDTD